MTIPAESRMESFLLLDLLLPGGLRDAVNTLVGDRRDCPRCALLGTTRKSEVDPDFIIFGEMEMRRAETMGNCLKAAWVAQGQPNENPDSAGEWEFPEGWWIYNAGNFNHASPLCSRPRRKAVRIHRCAEDAVERDTYGAAEMETHPSPSLQHLLPSPSVPQMHPQSYV